MENTKENKSLSYLSFRLGTEVFAAHVSMIHNILEMQKITRIPKAPEYLLGMINLRGSALPLIDTRIKLDITANELTSESCIIVCELNIDEQNIMIGILVDSVQEVLEISDNKILPPPQLGINFKSEFLQGVFDTGEIFIMILDLVKIFTENEINILKNVQYKKEAQET